MLKGTLVNKVRTPHVIQDIMGTFEGEPEATVARVAEDTIIVVHKRSSFDISHEHLFWFLKAMEYKALGCFRNYAHVKRESLSVTITIKKEVMDNP